MFALIRCMFAMVGRSIVMEICKILQHMDHIFITYTNPFLIPLFVELKKLLKLKKYCGFGMAEPELKINNLSR